MKVKVRSGFVVNYTERVKQGEGPTARIQEREQNIYPEDGAVDLEEKRVKEHAHKLEPASKEAEQFLEKLAVPSAPAPTAAGAIDVQAIATAAAIAAIQATQPQVKPAGA